ncbi:hypothetical protein ARALYDRAFT_908361 [Arabidopsis lyrata subsp. lyrata]|uniref:PGG domain-containing protein n=1 Tax=Arabidopsis lyrata subsp. lyrata TaxID=81972 RepID=D7LXM2_ARALL|nr:hypothetical protein ARALYDRAFT_908361 [Arabidopsis lyrata subsp. lyrata]
MASSSGNVLSSSQGVAGSSGNVPGSSQGVSDLGEICEYLSLSQNISDDDLEHVKVKFSNLQRDTTTAWIDPFETPLQNACSRRQLAEIVKKLLLHEMTSRGQMANDIYCQSLALDIAAGSGNLKMVRDLCELYPNQLLAQDNSVSYGLAIPVVRASNAGHGKVTGNLYFNNQNILLPILKDKQGYWATCLLLDAIFYGFLAWFHGLLDIALDIIINVPSVAVTKHASQRSTPLKFLALKPDLFHSHSAHSNLGFWRRFIYSCIMQTYDLKERHSQAQNLLKKMCTELPGMVKDNSWKEMVYGALLEAVKNGNKEFFIEIIKCNPQLLWIWKADSGRNLFQLAVEFKKDKIFNLIHGLDDRKVTLLRSYDNKNNNILHIAAHLSTPDQLSKISGAALKMQRETQWFKEVKSLVSEREVVQKNNKKKTPRQIFEDSHETLRKEGEEWMKYTATACSFVAALIATVTFQAIFTVPGGTDQTSGAPILLHDLHFTGFIFTNTLAFFASCISVLIFLNILTSRYSFDDFIVSLPRKMILGQSILFISIASMLVSFITSLSASMRHRPTLVVPLKPLASFPSILFLMLQYPLLKEMISSTYGKRLFYRDTKNWLP